MLRRPNGAAVGNAPPLIAKRSLKHFVRYYEKGDHPLEYITTRQWFVRLLDKKAQLLEKGEEINWYPSFMLNRYRDWTQNLNMDWCISRQRYFGVPFPVWYPIDNNGIPDYAKPIIAAEDQLPVDPAVTCPSGYSEGQRGIANGFVAEADVFDTWFTSSLTPQIASRWLVDEDRHSKLFPMDLRPQSHEIIRTWAFYTIVKSLLHENIIPWKNINISGWVLDPDRKKMSKSKGNVIVPTDLLEKYSSDALRYWAGNARLGVDTAYDENIVKIGNRLVVKIYNASKFVLSQKGPGNSISCELDRAFIDHLRKAVRTVTEQLNEYNFCSALSTLESFFWHSFTDSYLELSKKRTWGGDGIKSEDQGSSIAAQRLGLKTLIKMFAPFIPYICEEVWSWEFAGETGIKSISIAPWPNDTDFKGISPPDKNSSFDVAQAVYSAVNKAKAAHQLPSWRSIESIVIHANPNIINIIEPIASDLKAAIRSTSWELLSNTALKEDVIDVSNIIFSK